MKLALTDDQHAIAAAAADLLSAQAARPGWYAAAPAAGPAADAAFWSGCADLGWFCLGIPEDRGGVGCGPMEEVLLFRELGRFLAPGPFLSTVAAGWVAAGAGAGDLAADLFTGRTRAGLAAGDYILDGEAGGAVLVTGEAGFELRPVTELTGAVSVDESVRLSRGAQGGPLAAFADPLLLARAELLVAAAQVGIAEAVRDASVAHARTRQQFGRPIGSFQAVKHRCAEMAIRCYAAYAQTLLAAGHLERRTPDAAFHAAAAKTIASSAARRNAADNIQNHGAIGFTQEHIAGRFARRAQVLHQCLDTGRTARRVVGPARQRYETLPAPVPDWFAAAAGVPA